MGSDTPSTTYIAMHPGRSLQLSEMADPVSRSRRGDILRRLPMIVYKVGTATELTIGRLVRIQDNSPKGWYTLNEDGEEETDDEETEEAEKDDDEWLGVVEWMDPLFSASGDSGSLVFAREDGIHIPLGIHVGSPDSEQSSFHVERVRIN